MSAAWQVLMNAQGSPFAAWGPVTVSAHAGSGSQADILASNGGAGNPAGETGRAVDHAADHMQNGIPERDAGGGATALCPVLSTENAGPTHPRTEARAERALTIEGPTWTFTAPKPAWKHCSDRKRHIFGAFAEGGMEHAAVAVAFPASPLDFGVELASLMRLSSLGVGPRALAWCEIPSDLAGIPGTPGAGVGAGGTVPVLIEEDAGVSLFAALHGRPIPGSGPGGAGEGQPLAPLGTEQRRLENAKIAFDIACQLKAMHDAGIYHRDVRSANVCVRRFGERAQDLRATLIDFELVSDAYAGEPSARCPACYDRLFGSAHEIPSALTVDMGYLLLLGYELDETVPPAMPGAGGAGAGATGVPGEAGGPQGAPACFGAACEEIFTYDRFGNARARLLDQVRDIDRLAAELGLEKLDDHAFANGDVARRARQIVHHGGYVDRADLDLVDRDPECLVATVRERLARRLFEHYKDDVRRTGGRVDYERFDEQPPDLVASNYHQAAGIVAELREAGLGIVAGGTADGRGRARAGMRARVGGRAGARAGAEASAAETGVRANSSAATPLLELDDARVEQIAMLEHERWRAERTALGWTYAPVKDVARRTNPNLVAFAELDDAAREWNRAFARRLPQLLAECGFIIVEIRPART